MLDGDSSPTRSARFISNERNKLTAARTEVTRHPSSIDPVSFKILWSRLVGVAEEACATLRHCAFASIVSEGHDCTAVLFDANGRELAEPVSFTATSFVGTMPRTMKLFLQHAPPAEWRQGDVLICNDPWVGTGHLFDICMAVPIFHNGRLVAFAASTAHSPDIGGASGNIDVRDVFEEGLQIPFTWLYREGRQNSVALDFIKQNVRVPDQVIGDINAQVSANLAMARRVSEVMDDTGLTDWDAFSDMVNDASEAAMKQALVGIPEGTYRYELRTDIGLDIVCSLTSHGDGTVTVDYTGTSPQVPKAINCPIHYTIARTNYALKAVLIPSVPSNESVFHPVRVLAPEGSIVNPTFPSPVSARTVTGHFLPDAVMGALGEALPDRVLANGTGPAWAIVATGERPGGGRFSSLIFFAGGQGASATKHGMDVVTYPGNAAGTPIELLERETCLRVEWNRLRRDSGGEGRQRGGWGQDVGLRVVGDAPVRLTFWADRTITPAAGRLGGGEGRIGRVTINGQSVDVKRHVIAEPGDLLTIETPGGGGFGVPIR